MTDLKRLEIAKAKEYLDFKDVMLISNLSESTIRTNIKEGKLKTLPTKPRQRRLFRKTDVVQWIEKGYTGVFRKQEDDVER